MLTGIDEFNEVKELLIMAIAADKLKENFIQPIAQEFSKQAALDGIDYQEVDLYLDVVEHLLNQEIHEN